MSRRVARRAVLPIAVAAALTWSAVADAYTVTVHVHGAGSVSEFTDAHLMNCTTPSAVSETTVTDCTAGSASGDYGWGWTVGLRAAVPQSLYDRGWRFLKWVDSNAGGGQINCDPQDQAGDHLSADCQFAIYENLQTNLYFDDVAGPNDTTITSGPPTPTNSTSATFAFDAPSDPDSRYDCKLDKPGAPGSWVACGTPLDKGESYSGLAANGAYTFSVRGRDLSGNVDPTPASRSWTVDTVPPVVSIGGSPAAGAVTNSTGASFTVSAGESATFACTLDGVGTACGTPKTGLGEGAHTFAVSATDAAGNTGTASRTWTVDTTAPTASITSGPAAGAQTEDPAASFGFGASETASFECSLDGGAYAACSSPKAYAGLPDGSHTFAVRATDTAGNTGTSATRSWIVDRTAPETTFVSAPAQGSATGAAVDLAFAASEPATFECRLDGAAFAACTSPVHLDGLSEGSHTFAVRATDPYGHTDTTPAERTWTVDTTAPDTLLLDGPAAGSTTPERTATFSFAAPESGASFECRLDGAAFAACASPYTLSDLPLGDHTFEVRARDAAGNVDGSPVSRSWRVNTLDADGDGINRPADCRDDDPTIRPGAIDRPGDGIDQDCDGVDPPVPPAQVSLAYRWKVAGARTTVLRLKLSRLDAGSTVLVRCKGRGCPLKSRRVSVRKAGGSVDVRKLLRRRPLRAGVRLSVTVSAADHVTRVVTFVVRRGKAPTGSRFACLPAGAKKPVRCA